MKYRALPVMALACLFVMPAAVRSQEVLESAVEAARGGRVEAAMEIVDEALATDPADARALFTRGLILAEAGRGEDAAAAFRVLIARHPDLPEAYNNLAVLQAADGDFDGAVSTLKAALATNPSYQTAYENLTRIFAQLASEAYSRALEVESAPAREQVELQMLAALSPSVAPPPAMPPPAKRPAPTMAGEPAAGAGDRSSEPVVAAETTAEAPGEAGGDEALTGGPAPAAAVESETLEDMERAPAPPVSDLAGVVDEWARAWSEQRVDDYLAFYADDFVPDAGMTRPDWESNRRQRIEAPDYIKVEVAILDSMSEDADRAKVTFLQAYESNTYSDQVTKTLTLVRRGAAWKILEEKSGS